MSIAKRVDANQSEIVGALRKIGCLVSITSDAGNGFPDIVVYAPRVDRVLLIEIKDGAKPPSERKLTPAQVKFHAEWDQCGDLHVVSSVEQAINVALTGKSVDKDQQRISLVGA